MNWDFFFFYLRNISIQYLRVLVLLLRLSLRVTFDGLSKCLALLTKWLDLKFVSSADLRNEQGILSPLIIIFELSTTQRKSECVSLIIIIIIIILSHIINP